MTKFDKSRFDFHGGYLHYTTQEGERKFVARFKHVKGDRAGFTKFLIANFSVEEYFRALEIEKKSPLPILEAKGYVMAHIKKWLRDAGLPETQEGQRMLIQQRVAARA